MLRREFLMTMGSSAFLAFSHPLVGAAKAGETRPGFDDDPIGGYTKTPPRAYLFTDHRLIRPSDLGWVGPDGKGLPVAGPPEPMVDARAVPNNVPHGIRLVAQPASTDPVEGDPPLPPGQVVSDDGVYWAFGLQVDYQPGKSLGAYSTAPPNEVSISASRSNDLYEWQDLGRCKLTLTGQTSFDGFTVFIDNHGSPNERFKAVYMAHPPEDQVPALWEAYQKIHPRHRDVRLRPDNLTCIYGMTSPDGVNWTPIREPLMVHKSDTDTTVYYDEWLGRYVMYTRLYPTDRRTIAIAEAEDFRKWGPVSPLIWPGLEEPLSTDIYTNARTCYPGMPEVHLMFPMFYHRFDQTSEIRLFSSIDGLHWSQVPGGPILTRDSFRDRSIEFIVASKPLLPLANDRVGFRYSATPYPHKYPRWKEVLGAGKGGWAWWEKGRLAALTADEEGEFTTFEIPVMGRELRINARTPRAGMIKVGLGDRRIEECDPIVGDSLAHAVRWKGSPEVGVGQGQSVSIRFHLRSAELFGFEWA